MFLILLGIIIFIVASVVLRNNPALEKFKPIGRIVGLAFILLGIVTTCVKQIDAGEDRKSVV